MALSRNNHLTHNKGIKWDVESGARNLVHEPLVYKTIRREEGKIISFATITTRVGGCRKVFKAEVTVLGSNGKVATTLDRIFEGRGCQYSARKWAEIMLFYPPARVITHVEM